MSEVIMYADDTSILISTKSYHDLQLQIEAVLCHMSKWFNVNHFMLNIDKTNVINFIATETTNYQLFLTLHDKQLKAVDTANFLVLQLDNHLTYKKHTDCLLQKLSTVCFLVRKL
jgi:hypothetical protein